MTCRLSRRCPHSASAGSRLAVFDAIVQDRRPVTTLAAQVQAGTGDAVAVACVAQGDPGARGMWLSQGA
jgi:hypothetical protein